MLSEDNESERSAKTSAFDFAKRPIFIRFLNSLEYFKYLPFSVYLAVCLLANRHSVSGDRSFCQSDFWRHQLLVYLFVGCECVFSVRVG